VVVLLTGCGRV